MWPARSAIPTIPAHAMVSRDAVDAAEEALSARSDLESGVERALDAMESAQPALSAQLDAVLDVTTDETAEALAQFLSVIAWRSFVEAFGARLNAVEASSLAAARAMFEYDEELRRGDPHAVLESDDVVAIGQPHLVGFLRDQIEAALEPDEDGEPAEADPDAVDAVYKSVLVMILAMGQSVAPPRGVVLAPMLA
ncbi:MAG: hypothetical protein JNK72_07610 [Myxococcales bacterium]|nr:hypothetical protein [Myxococcales bacterium]